MRIFHPDFYRTIRNINGAVSGQDGAGSYEQVFSARTYFSGSKRRVRMGGNGEVLKLSYAVL